ncbi:hypothetical protein BDR05DRAFT_946703 [Suillus weaverae]|nr:hypothetical protein BDR05DRAFT_946703 [Suillus weaverae]
MFEDRIYDTALAQATVILQYFLVSVLNISSAAATVPAPGITTGTIINSTSSPPHKLSLMPDPTILLESRVSHKSVKGSEDAIDCVSLDCLGPWHQQHADGHEKLSAQALRMGDITLPIYAFKDQFSTFVPYMCCLPNVRLSNVIGHVFLDLIEEHGCIPIQLTTDKGSEINGLHQDKCRANTTHQSKGFGIGSGMAKVTAYIRPYSLVEMQHLDQFQLYWNNHHLSLQKKKVLPTRISTHHIWLAPDSVRALVRDCLISIDMDLVQELQEELGGLEARDTAFQFIDVKFQAMADDIFCNLGFPDITLANAWDVFVAVVDILEHTMS